MWSLWSILREIQTLFIIIGYIWWVLFCHCHPTWLLPPWKSNYLKLMFTFTYFYKWKHGYYAYNLFKSLLTSLQPIKLNKNQLQAWQITASGLHCTLSLFSILQLKWRCQEIMSPCLFSCRPPLPNISSFSSHSGLIQYEHDSADRSF